MTLKVKQKIFLPTILTVAVVPTVTKGASSVNYIFTVGATFLDLEFLSIC